MKRIIEYGKQMIITCPDCGCKFSYEKSDIKMVQTHINEYKDYVSCPQCGKEVEARG